MLPTIFIVLALLMFLIGTVNPQWPSGRAINWVAAGLALLTLAWLVVKGA